VECGTWKGGMIAGIADVLGPAREYWLYDSFEGLPPAKEIDGAAALSWQANTNSPIYFDNCRAEEAAAYRAMSLSGCRNYNIIKGWFNETLRIRIPGKIAILRLDADWYDSTMVCLENLFHLVVPGGIVIVDDYYVFEGCSKAIHDFLSHTGASEKIGQFDGSVLYIKKV
jgi:hypothetical protein